MTTIYRKDRIGPYIVSTARFPDELAALIGARYETMVFCLGGDDARTLHVDEWEADESAVQTTSTVDADAAHDAACERMRGRIQ